ncbi:type VI secretion system Vgr family protein [Enhygromyxa salina]|uniref:type VI secretion system Vgr family protein n=1 Tax=Enhygromyxa salina TaxID=215803 RepID=UPI0015E5E88D|nr:type VI secretion system tip protein TssI/VgrG [Enhygromyxa salina]
MTYELALPEHPGAWSVTRVWISEALNEPYRALIDAATEAEDPDTDALLGADIILTITRGIGEGRTLCGLVSRIDFLGYEDHHLIVRFHVLSAVEILCQRVNSRIWQQLSVQDIVSEVLGEGLGDYARSFDMGSVSRGVRPRDYCVQYRESDFALVSRLLEEEGISYEFIHDTETNKEILTLRDDNDQYGELENIDGTAEIPIIISNPDEADVESIQGFEWSKQLTTTGALRRDYDWRTPREVLSARAEAPDDRDRERRVFAHGGRRFIDDDLATRARDAQHGALLSSRIVRGRSNVSAMRPGLRFTLSGHDRIDLEREYLITEVVHTGAELSNVGSSSDPGASGQGYSNSFVCVPFDADLRPRRVTPSPREYGPQTAIVTGPDGEEIHTDEHGRIQVQFYWQEEPSYAAGSSCWIRCSQSWAGMGWGAQFIPRIGMEVVVEFMEGNPDRPLVTGCVYNAEYPPPFTLPDNKTQSGWRTESSPGGGGSNELRFEDAADDEEIYLHGEKNWTIEIEHDKHQTVGHDEYLEVARDRTKKVGHDESFEIGHDQRGQVGHDQTLTVGHDQQSSIGENRTDAIGKDAQETVGESKTVTVGAMLEQTVGESMNTTVAENATTSIGKDHTVTVGENASESVSGDKFVESKNSTTRTSKDMSFASDEKYLVEAAKDIGVTGETNIVVEAKKKMVFKCGDASITLKKDGKIVIKGKDVTVKGSGNVVIKGQKVAEN